MGVRGSIPLPYSGIEVNTACGGKAHFAPDTPRAVYDGKWVFFCLPTCKQEFDKDPASSCLSEQITPDISE
ncbi:MAG: hypothetical protein A2Z45_05690 [Chloroflexi bacterium RBG_19FT_COMBO_55_16]|nr:MAG: hypothetical protein A2Z45_05690 [Chloroflexi bacterium RBG_19FT_COMBO_55_16]